MSHPALWSNTVFFYPLGNTPPVCLTQDFPPELDLDLLLLGCGDPRSILFTLYAQQKVNDDRKLDFTCCDIEPAVLARNVVLLAMIIDNHPIDEIWNIFFHFQVSPASSALLVSQCQKLLSVSSDLTTWRNSPYAACLAFRTTNTLAQLRRCWEYYSGSASFTDAKNKELLAKLRYQFEVRNGDLNKSTYVLFSAARSAGLFWTDASDALKTHFVHFWQTGSLSRDPKELRALKHVNPTFVFSQGHENCTMHYGTYPLQCFHLSNAYTAKGEVKEIDLVRSARTQFRNWATSFRQVASSDKVTIRFAACDVLALSRTLLNQRLTGQSSAKLYTAPWQASELVLLEDSPSLKPAPTVFDLIDTSNIADHVGLLNILIGTIRLIRPALPSVLYTETLVAPSIGHHEEASVFETLLDKLPLFAILLGVAPTACVSQFTSDSRAHELMGRSLSGGMGTQRTQYQERVAWKIPHASGTHSPVIPAFRPGALAQAMFDVYYGLFCQMEDMSKKLEKLFGSAKAKAEDLNFGSVIHVHRATFVAFLELVQWRVGSATDWTKTMECLYDIFHQDTRLILHSNCYQEVCCELFMRGVYCVTALDSEHPSKTSIRRDGVFKGWADVPAVVCVVLVIPRDKIKVLSDKPPEEIGSPMLECSIRGTSFQNIYSNVQIVFGRSSTSGQYDQKRVTIREDLSSWGGTSDLVMSVWVPAFNLTLHPNDTDISLSVRSTPITSELSAVLDPMLELFSASALDTRSVHVTRWRPNLDVDFNVFRPLADPETPSADTVVITVQGGNILSMTKRWSAPEGTTERGLLSNRQVSISAEKISPSSIVIALGTSFRHVLVYPFPVQVENLKLRIARSSGYIEVETAPQWPPQASDVFSQNHYTSFFSGNSPCNWNIHGLNFGALPVIKVSQNPKTKHWLPIHLGLSLSDRELELRKTGSLEDVLVNVKDTIASLILRLSEASPARVFSLFNPENGGIYTIIFVNNVRLDPPCHTIVVDACVLPLSEQLVKSYGQTLADLTCDGKMIDIVTKDQEVRAWKHLLPVFVERSRTWKHMEDCQYIQAGRIPLSDELEKNPLCDCGQGKDLGEFQNVGEWRKLRRFFTRVAFSPLFAVSYLESVGSAVMSAGKRTGEAEVSGHSCAGCGDLESGGNAFKQCGRCRLVYYCGKQCQTADWKSHKANCKKL